MCLCQRPPSLDLGTINPVHSGVALPGPATHSEASSIKRHWSCPLASPVPSREPLEWPSYVDPAQGAPTTLVLGRDPASSAALVSMRPSRQARVKARFRRDSKRWRHELSSECGATRGGIPSDLLSGLADVPRRLVCDRLPAPAPDLRLLGGPPRRAREVSDFGKSAEVPHRYSDFEGLHRSLLQDCPNVRLPNLPPKGVDGSDAAVVASRKVELERMLRAMLTSQDVSGGVGRGTRWQQRGVCFRRCACDPLRSGSMCPGGDEALRLGPRTSSNALWTDATPRGPVRTTQR